MEDNYEKVFTILKGIIIFSLFNFLLNLYIIFFIKIETDKLKLQQRLSLNERKRKIPSTNDPILNNLASTISIFE